MPIGNTAGETIHDFVHSNYKGFKGKSKQERIRMALGAFYSNKSAVPPGATPERLLALARMLDGFDEAAAAQARQMSSDFVLHKHWSDKLTKQENPVFVGGARAVGTATPVRGAAPRRRGRR